VTCSSHHVASIVDQPLWRFRGILHLRASRLSAEIQDTVLAVRYHALAPDAHSGALIPTSPHSGGDRGGKWQRQWRSDPRVFLMRDVGYLSKHEQISTVVRSYHQRKRAPLQEDESINPES
jgi:hypothetical protein